MRFIFYLIIAVFIGICLLPFGEFSNYILLIIITSTLFYIASLVNDIHSQLFSVKSSHVETLEQKEKDASQP